MTIADAAKVYGVTQQAVYQKLKRKGIKRADIQQPGSAELTEEGERIISSLFKQDQHAVTQQALKSTQEVIDLTQRLQTVSNDLEAKTAEAEDLKQTVSKLNQDLAASLERLKEATEERDFLRLTVAQLNENNRLVLAALQPSQHEKGLLARIKARFARKEKAE